MVIPALIRALHPSSHLKLMKEAIHCLSTDYETPTKC